MTYIETYKPYNNSGNFSKMIFLMKIKTLKAIFRTLFNLHYFNNGNKVFNKSEYFMVSPLHIKIKTTLKTKVLYKMHFRQHHERQAKMNGVFCW